MGSMANLYTLSGNRLPRTTARSNGARQPRRQGTQARKASVLLDAAEGSLMAHDFAEWWKRWWEADYSWEAFEARDEDGTPKHPWIGWVRLSDGSVVEEEEGVEGEAATLQDYWRDQENDLFESPVSGKKFTRVHMPLEWENGEPTEKKEWGSDTLEWRSLNKALKDRLAACTATSTQIEPIAGVDRRAQLRGTVLPMFDVHALAAFSEEKDGHASIAVCFDQAFFFGYGNFQGAAFSSFAAFHGAAFSGDADFTRTEFSNVADFENAVFANGAMFPAAGFSDKAYFQNVAFCGKANFNGAAYSGLASFDFAIFNGEADFRNAAFSNMASFRGCTFSLRTYFQSAAFPGFALFEAATFSRAVKFQSVVFAGLTNFSGAAFSGDADFQTAAFSGAANFQSAAFAGVANFKGAAFSNVLGFRNVLCKGVAYFSGEGAELFAPQTMKNIILARNRNAKGEHSGNLIEAAYVKPLARRAFKSIAADGAVFLDDAFFDNRDILEHSSFRGVLFHRRAFFHGSRLHHGVSFHEARFLNALAPEISPVTRYGSQDHQFSEGHLNLIFKAEKRLAKGSSSPFPADKNRWCASFYAEQASFAEKFARHWQSLDNDGKYGDDKKYFRRETKNQYFESLENAFRTLKLIMEERRDRSTEGMFFRLELQARRKRRDGGVPFWERLFSDIYGWSSDYGNSALLPLARLIGFTLVFAVIYGCAGNWPLRHLPVEEGWQALSFSTSRVLPFGPWTGEPEAGTLIGRLFDVEGKGYGTRIAYTFRFIASVQSLIALIMVFLAGLAIRRRFQIS